MFHDPFDHWLEQIWPLSVALGSGRMPGLSQMKSSKEYRSLAAECLRLAATTDDANSYAQYVALAQMWNDLADEAEKRRATFSQAQNAHNDAQMVQQQEQVQPKGPEAGDKN
jgi:hypothetical protein